MFGRGKILEARIVISAEDQTAKVFDAFEARVARATKAMQALGRAGARAGIMSRYFDEGGGGDMPRRRRGVESAETARRRHLRELAEARAYRREVIASGAHTSGLGMVTGLAAGFAVHEVAKASAARVHERVRMQVAGMSAGETRDAEVEAAKLAAQFPALGQTELMHMLRNARSIVGSYKEAAEIMEPLAKLRVVAQGARPGADVSEDFDQLVKGLEIKGVTQDPKKFKDYMEGIAKGLNVFGDTLKPYQYYEMFKYGRQATPGLSQKFILGTAPTLAQELGGSSYGNAVSGFNRSVVGGRMEHPAIKEMARLGLLAHGDIDWLKTGEAKGIKTGHSVHGWELAQSDPNEWVKQYLIPALNAHGITDSAAVMKEIGILFTNRMSAQLVSLLATQQARINKDMALLDHAKGLDAANDYASKDPNIAWGGLKTSIEGAAGTIGAGLAAALTPSMNNLAQAIAGYTARLSQAQKDVAEGKVPQGQRDLQRTANLLTKGVDFDGPMADIPPMMQLDADYNRRRDTLLKRRDEVDEDARLKWRRYHLGAHAYHDPASFEGKQLAAQQEEETYPMRAGADADLRELERVHAARVAAEKRLAEFRAGVKHMMMFANGPHGDDHPNVSLGPTGLPLGTAYFGAPSRTMSYSGIDPKSGAPPAPPPHVAPPSWAGTTDLASLLNGKVEAKVTPDQILAKVEGQVQGSVSIKVEASADLKATIAAAKGGSDKQFNMKVGAGAPDTGPAGRKP